MTGGFGIACRLKTQFDAMSDAVDNAELMLSCVSLGYKESASKGTPVCHARCACAFCCVCRILRSNCGFPCVDCRLEAQYGHRQEVDMIPLVQTIFIVLTMSLWFLNTYVSALPPDDGERLQGHRVARLDAGY